MILLTIDFDSTAEKTKLHNVLKVLNGKQVVQIKKHQKNRSTRENAYYWGVIVKELSNWSGYDPDQMHEVLKMKFLREDKVIKSTGELVPGFKSTKDLSVPEFEAYCENIRIWAISELEVYLPLPGETI